MAQPKILKDKKNKEVPHFAYITEELTQVIDKLEARQKYLEVGYDKLWNEMSLRTCNLAKYIDKILDQQNRILEIIGLFEKKHEAEKERKKR
jgi:hypothetical protein